MSKGLGRKILHFPLRDIRLVATSTNLRGAADVK